MHSDPTKKTLHMQKLAPFAYLTNYIKEIQLIDKTKRPIEPISISRPYVPVVLNFQYAVRPKSVNSCGTSRQDWEICLN
jgi:hypothetical protein